MWKRPRLRRAAVILHAEYNTCAAVARATTGLIPIDYHWLVATTGAMLHQKSIGIKKKRKEKKVATQVQTPRRVRKKQHPNHSLMLQMYVCLSCIFLMNQDNISAKEDQETKRNF